MPEGNGAPAEPDRLRTAADLLDHAAAAGDTVAGLRHGAGAREAIREPAAQVGTGGRALPAATTEFRDGVDRAETGRAADTLGAHSDRVDQKYRDAASVATATAEAGARIA